jgi:hypothetical protein
LKLHILDNSDDNVKVLDRSNPERLEVHQDCSDGTAMDWTISRADFLAARVPLPPEAVPLPTVTNAWTKNNSVGGHWWLANSTYWRVFDLAARSRQPGARP